MVRQINFAMAVAPSCRRIRYFPATTFPITAVVVPGEQGYGGLQRDGGSKPAAGLLRNSQKGFDFLNNLRAIAVSIVQERAPAVLRQLRGCGIGSFDRVHKY